ncbi:hypothetical protein [Natrinema ejinorense]|uniref:hypothetical protein n=1 Tax=Natrinema ejinorense TaxID=373386 RepID=UPI00147627A0|nr:hypothetical protein [Natrinema ejinorense]
MAQAMHIPTKAASTTAAAVRKTLRIALPLGLAVAITGVGLFVFFQLVTALLS